MDKKKNRLGNIVYSTSNDWQPEHDNSVQENLPPQKQLGRVRLDKKHRAGKTVTIIEGLVMNENEFENLAKKLKSYCGSGGSSKDNVIIIQGDHIQKIIDWLHKNGFILSKKTN
ncbi:MAG: translation initiation factor [Ginsengibacter sp.]